MVDLAEYIKCPLPNRPVEVTVASHWLAVEGVQPAIAQNPPVIVLEEKRPDAGAPTSKKDATPPSAAVSSAATAVPLASVKGKGGSSAVSSTGAAVEVGGALRVAVGGFVLCVAYHSAALFFVTRGRLEPGLMAVRLVKTCADEEHCQAHAKPRTATVLPLGD